MDPHPSAIYKPRQDVNPTADTPAPDHEDFRSKGAAIAYALAAGCDQGEKPHPDLLQAVEDMPADGFLLAVTYALQTLAEDVLTPLLAAVHEDTRTDLLARFRATSESLNRRTTDTV